jgi:hypothetical protein
VRQPADAGVRAGVDHAPDEVVVVVDVVKEKFRPGRHHRGIDHRHGTGGNRILVTRRRLGHRAAVVPPRPSPVSRRRRRARPLAMIAPASGGIATGMADRERAARRTGTEDRHGGQSGRRTRPSGEVVQYPSTDRCFALQLAAPFLMQAAPTSSVPSPVPSRDRAEWLRGPRIS